MGGGWPPNECLLGYHCEIRGVGPQEVHELSPGVGGGIPQSIFREQGAAVERPPSAEQCPPLTQVKCQTM